MTQAVLYALVILFGAAAYVVALRQMYAGSYRPNAFSRLIWMLLAINSLAAVIATEGSIGAIIFSIVMLTGSTAMSLASIKKGTWQFGRLELVCLVMLALSGLVWFLSPLPLLTLVITRVIHLVGALPTIKRVWRDPASESSLFWLLFTISSVFAVVASGPVAWTAVIMPLYYVVFDGVIFALAVRKRHVKHKLRPAYSV